MRVEVIQAINNNLQQLALLINVLDTKTYLDVSVGPYYSSIGSHSRHILDFFNCIIDGLDENKIDLTSRKREEIISTNKEAALIRIAEIQKILIDFADINTDYLVHVTDNLGQGNVTVSYTLESILAHANSHAVHHYATIGYMLYALNVEHSIAGFGYNPTTPIVQRKGI